MSLIPPSIFSQLGNLPVRKLIRALEQDGFSYQRRRGNARVYRHSDGRRVVLHYHHGGDTLPTGTLRSFMEGTQWSEADLRRLKLI